jgi:hypothetical protein
MAELIFKENTGTVATPATGYVKLYAKSDGKLYSKNDSGSELELLGQKDSESKSIAVESPTGSEDITFFFTPVAITITEMRAVLVGGTTPSITWTIRHATDRTAAGNEVVTSGTTTTSDTTGSDVTSFNDATVPADSFVWLETTAASGGATALAITVVFDED